MSASPCRISTPTVQKTDPFTTIKAINRSELTKGAKILYSQLRVSAGPKGFVYYRVHRLAEDTNSSISSTKEYLQELRAVGLVIPEHRPGRSNVWHVYDPSPDWDGKVPESCAQPVDRPGGSRCADGGSADPPAPLKNVLQNVRTKRSTFQADEDSEVRVPEANVRDEMNDENVVKSWLKQEEEAPKPASSVEPPVRAPGDPDTLGDTEIQNPLHSSVFSHDPACAPGAACTPGDPDIQAPDTEEPQYSSAKFEDHVPDDHFARAKTIPTPKTEKVQEKSEFSQNHGHQVRGDHGDRGDSPVRVRVPDDHGADARTRIRKVFDTTLLTEILEVTGDYKSRGCWISVIRQVDEDSIRYGLSCLKQAEADGTMIERPGGYLLSVLREHNDIRFGSKAGRSGTRVSQGTRTSDRVSSTVDSGHQVPLEPQRRAVFVQTPEPEPPAPNPEELIKGFRFSVQAIGMERTLSLMERTVEGINVRELWDQVKSLMPDSDPRSVADRFFQVLLTRLKHLEAQR